MSFNEYDVSDTVYTIVDGVVCRYFYIHTNFGLGSCARCIHTERSSRRWWFIYRNKNRDYVSTVLSGYCCGAWIYTSIHTIFLTFTTHNTSNNNNKNEMLTDRVKPSEQTNLSIRTPNKVRTHWWNALSDFPKLKFLFSFSISSSFWILIFLFFFCVLLLSSLILPPYHIMLCLLFAMFWLCKRWLHFLE